MMSNPKASWLANAKRIALEADALEKKTGTGLRSDELKYESIDMARLRNEAKADTIKRVHGIRLVLTDIQNKIKMNTWQSSNALKNQLETFESKLSAFKMLMRSAYDTLEESATSLETDIYKLNGEMDMWDHASVEADASSVPDPETQKRISERNKTDLERRAFIGALDRKIAALGRDDGWDPRDHDAFVRVWLMAFENTDMFEAQLTRAREAEGKSAHKDDGGDSDQDELSQQMGDMAVVSEDALSIPASKRSLVIKKLSASVPWKSLEEIDDHINWYLRYLQLTLIKKKALNEWKQEQLSAKRQLQDDILVSDILNPGEAAAGDSALNSSTGGDGAADARRVPGSSEKDRAAAKARIAAWRAAQAKQLEDEKEEKARVAAAEARQADEERRRKQSTLKEQLGKWKASEELNKELMGEASAKLQRPKSVDPAALRRRQAKDLETARTRSEKVDLANQKKTLREKTIMEAAVAVTGVGAERDPNRLLAGTKASENNKLTYEALDQAERRRGSVGAHGANVALNARDLQFAGRATPQWIKSARGGY